MKNIVLCCTIPDTFGFSLNLITQLKDSGVKVTLVSSDEAKLKQLAQELDVYYKYVPFYRGMNPLKDLSAIYALYKILKNEKPDVIVGATPKAAMVSMIAAKMAKVKNRIYHIYGLPYETAKGLKFKLLLGVEKLTGTCASHIVPIGTSVKISVLSHRLFPEKKMIQHGLLTVGGVDIDRFNPVALEREGKELRHSLNIPDGDIVIGYVARLTYDKGFGDLVDIWGRIKKHKNVHLLIVGSVDRRVPLPEEMLDSFFSQERVHNLGFRMDVEKCFAAMDIFLFPSYREGFGNVSIEASAMEIPVITYDVTGCKDAVQNDVSGFIVPFRDYNAVVSRLKELSDNEDLRLRLGRQGRQRVMEYFTNEIVANNFIDIIHNATV